MPTPTKRTISPAFQFYPKDFLSSTKVQRMSLTEIGAYIVLLSHCWLNDGLPTEPDQLARIVKVPGKQFARMWAGALSECFETRRGRLQNERLDQERAKQLEFRRRQTDNGTKGGRPKKTHSKPTGYETETHSKPRALEIGEINQLVVPSTEEKKEGRALDVAFAEFRDAYPKSRRKGGYVATTAYMGAVAAAGGEEPLLAALRNHLASAQWANPAHIPGMDTWLLEERWRQRLPAAGAVASSAANPKTAGNVPALQRFIDRGRAVNE